MVPKLSGLKPVFSRSGSTRGSAHRGRAWLAGQLQAVGLVHGSSMDIPEPRPGFRGRPSKFFPWRVPGGSGRSANHAGAFAALLRLQTSATASHCPARSPGDDADCAELEAWPEREGTSPQRGSEPWGPRIPHISTSQLWGLPHQPLPGRQLRRSLGLWFPMMFSPTRLPFGALSSL